MMCWCAAGVGDHPHHLGLSTDRWPTCFYHIYYISNWATGTYFNCIMFMVASSVVTTIMILNYHHRLPDTHTMPHWVTGEHRWCVLYGSSCRCGCCFSPGCPGSSEWLDRVILTHSNPSSWTTPLEYASTPNESTEASITHYFLSLLTCWHAAFLVDLNTYRKLQRNCVRRSSPLRPIQSPCWWRRWTWRRRRSQGRRPARSHSSSRSPSFTHNSLPPPSSVTGKPLQQKLG